MIKEFVSASWPYLHTIPGIHNAIPILAADVYARYSRLKGHEVVFTCGADEYGARMELVSGRHGIPEVEFADKNFKHLRSLLVEWLGVDFSFFSRTTDEYHGKYVRRFLLQLESNGYIYQKHYKLPYCPRCCRVLPDRFVEGRCPKCGKKIIASEPCKGCEGIFDPLELKEPRCAFCTEKPEAKNMLHWFFRVDRLRPLVKDYLEGKGWFSPEIQKYAESASRHFVDFPITRDIPWGIAAPFSGAECKTVFSWVDSLLGNLSILNSQGRNDLLNDKEVSSTYFMGWDNVPFYGFLLPSLLLSYDGRHELPTNIIAHHYLTFLGMPCSKSSGNGVWLDEAKTLLENPDCWRYFLLRRFPLKQDVNFEWDDFTGLIDNELVEIISKLVERSASLCGKQIAVPENPENVLAPLRDKTRSSVARFVHCMDRFEIPEAIDAVLDLARFGIDFSSGNSGATSDETACGCILLCQNIAVMFFPFLPKTSQKIWSYFGFNTGLAEQRWDSLGLGAPDIGARRTGELERLFEPSNKEELVRKFGKLRRKKEQTILQKMGEYCERWWER